MKKTPLDECTECVVSANYYCPEHRMSIWIFLAVALFVLGGLESMWLYIINHG